MIWCINIYSSSIFFGKGIGVRRRSRFHPSRRTNHKRSRDGTNSKGDRPNPFITTIRFGNSWSKFVHNAIVSMSSLVFFLLFRDHGRQTGRYFVGRRKKMEHAVHYSSSTVVVNKHIQLQDTHSVSNFQVINLYNYICFIARRPFHVGIPNRSLSVRFEISGGVCVVQQQLPSSSAILYWFFAHARSHLCLPCWKWGWSLAQFSSQTMSIMVHG